MGTADWRYRFYHLFWQGVDWIFPPECAGCGQPGTRWCPDCQRAVQPVSGPICQICGIPMHTAGVCPDCRAQKPAFQLLRSWAVFQDPLRQALHQLKYRRNMGLGEVLTLQMLDFVKSLGWPIEALIPIPLSAARFQERGYNQVGLVARPLAMLMSWHYLPGALQRIRNTRSQVGLSAEERRQNVHNAFQADAKQVKGRCILLMDDVATTGATLESAAQAVRSAGASQVYALTIARAVLHHRT